jgi:hypothetical protein
VENTKFFFFKRNYSINIPVRLDRHEGFDGSILGSSMVNNEP